MNELKPCPFCGNKAALEYDEKRNSIDVVCSYCNCIMSGFYVYYRHRNGAFEETAEKAIEEWNRRVSE